MKFLVSFLASMDIIDDLKLVVEKKIDREPSCTSPIELDDGR